MGVALLAVWAAGPLGPLGGGAAAPAEDGTGTRSEAGDGSDGSDGPGGTGGGPTAPPLPRAVDGDTVLLPNGERVRLERIDAPETGRPFADLARDHVQAFLEAGPVSLAPSAPPRDRYGRLLADLTRGPASLSASLVDAGLAWIYRDPSGSLLDTQAAAVEHRRGVHRGLETWSGGPLVVTGSGFHALGCSVVGSRRRNLPVEATPEGPLKEGRSPCRRCLPWPPRGWPRTAPTRR